jgi:hypothetical protein
MEDYPCVNATNIRLGSLIRYIDNNDKNRMAFVCGHKWSDLGLDYQSYTIQCVDNDQKLNISFANRKGFYQYLLVVSY